MELKRGPWTPEEDQKLFSYIQKHGHTNWTTLPLKAGLRRCGKSCRIRWINYLRPDIKRGKFTPQEEQTIIQLHALLGNRWSIIAGFLNNRTDNEIKNYWNCRLKKRLAKMGIDPSTHRRRATGSERMTHMAQWESTRLEAEARLVRKSNNKQDDDNNNNINNNNNTSLNSLESEILSNLKAMPHLYAARTLATSKPPCLDILKAWEIVSGLESGHAYSDHAPERRPSQDAVFENEGATEMVCFDDLWELLACDDDYEEGNVSKDDAGIFAVDAASGGGTRAGEELLIGCSFSYCGRLGSLLMH